MSTPVPAVINAGTQLKLAILPDGTFTKPLSAAFKTLVTANDIQLSFADTAVDVSTYGSGFAMQETKVSAQATAQISAIIAKDDDVYNTIILPCGGNEDTAKQNVFAELTDADGRVYNFAAQIRNLNKNMGLREVLRCTFSLVSQGEVAITFPTP